MKNENLLRTKTSTLAKSANILRLRSRTLAQEMKNGNFVSIFKGHGIDFAGVREYLAGDDVRSIDWNVTARMNKTFVKLYEEEREQTIFMILDRSNSMETGSNSVSRLNVATEAASLLLLAAQQNSCPVGTVLFDGKITFSCSPKKNFEHTMLLFKKITQRDDVTTNGSVLTNAIQGAFKSLKKRAMIFVISDFRTSGYEENLAQLAQKHDVVAIRIVDQNDFELVDVGLVRVMDVESHKSIFLPTNDARFQQEWRENYKNTISRWKYMCKKNGIIPLVISTADDVAIRLVKFFATRES